MDEKKSPKVVKPILRHIQPLGPRVLVRMIKHSDRSSAGLYLPEGVKEQHDDALYGQVVEVARTTHDEETLGENVSGVPVDAFVLFPKADGLTVPWDDDLRLVEVKSIFALVEEVDEDRIQ